MAGAPILHLHVVGELHEDIRILCYITLAQMKICYD